MTKWERVPASEIKIGWERVPASEIKIGDRIRFLDVRKSRIVTMIKKSKKGVTITAGRLPGDQVLPRWICSPGFQILRMSVTERDRIFLQNMN